jgi:hypothetical protein
MKKETILQPTPIELYQCLLITRTKLAWVWINHSERRDEVNNDSTQRRRLFVKVMIKLLYSSPPMRSSLASNVGSVVEHFGMSIDIPKYSTRVDNKVIGSPAGDDTTSSTSSWVGIYVRRGSGLGLSAIYLRHLPVINRCSDRDC